MVSNAHASNRFDCLFENNYSHYTLKPFLSFSINLALVLQRSNDEETLLLLFPPPPHSCFLFRKEEIGLKKSI